MDGDRLDLATRASASSVDGRRGLPTVVKWQRSKFSGVSMPIADRSMIVRQMIGLRPSSANRSSDVPQGSFLPYWRLFMSAEARILEIVELVAILRADGFSEPEVFARLRKAQGMMAVQLKATSDPLELLIVDYLRHHHPNYLELGEETWRSALSLAQVGAETAANSQMAAGWPPLGMLRERVKGGVQALGGYRKGPAGRDVRRLRARAIPGDELRRYSTDPLMWALMMGSGGYALVRKGRSLDYIQLRMN